MFSEEFEQVVSLHYEALYRFAFGLTRLEADASDLTQQTFYIWAIKGHQLRDKGKIKSWLFTTLRREFLNHRRRTVRFPHFELSEQEREVPDDLPEMVATLDATRAVELLGEVKEPYQAALTLFYLEDCSYREIATILEIPIGTVQSRISRGMSQLQRLMTAETGPTGFLAPLSRETSRGTVNHLAGHTSLTAMNIKSN